MYLHVTYNKILWINTGNDVTIDSLCHSGFGFLPPSSIYNIYGKAKEKVILLGGATETKSITC